MPQSKKSYALPLTIEDLKEVEREYCRRSLAHFAKRAWHVLEPATELKWGWAIDSICDHLEAVTRGEISRLLVNVPPGTMKSLLTAVIWPAWEWGALGMQEMRYLGTAHKQDLATRDSTKCRRLIQSAWYQNLWPVTLTGDQNAKTKFENTKTGFRESMAFGSMTGSRGDRVILDDPHSVDDANSKAKLKSDITTFREALPSRVNNDASAIVIIMQRLSVGDVSDVALELGYDHLLIPMEYEKGRSVHVVGKPDPRKKDGELMFPERFSPLAVDRLKKSLGSHGAAGQLQQRPNPRGGRIIQSGWFGRYSVAPKMKWRACYGDTAQKKGEANDYQVGECWGLGEDGKIYLFDILRDKFEAYELEHRFPAFWEKHKADDSSRLRYFAIEDKSSGTELIQKMRNVIKPKIPVKAIPRDKDKYSRLMDVLGFIESGYVMIPESAPWVADFLAECESFTADDTHAHDDQIDPMIDAIDDMLNKGSTSIKDML
jgi:predicted phage terminase large subunit-like protein